ncbi:MAG: hypothetical protein ACD_79C00902G0001 [uncultured bacterium]|nr:MAG: hypothetical protein ACD_79C00902G0001 [uncultured bacterium]
MPEMYQKKINILHLILILVITFFAVLILINIYVNSYSYKFIKSDIADLPRSNTVLVLGARVLPKNVMSNILLDRMSSAVELYKQKKVSKFLLSGDHGDKYYDEVNTMKTFLIKQGILGDDIFLDHAGFNTYDSIVRAKKIFQVNDLIIVTQKFHLNRSVYIARKIGLNAHGFIADRRTYFHRKYYAFREFFAKIKAFINVLSDKKPKFLGPAIPITGDSKLSWD